MQSFLRYFTVILLLYAFHFPAVYAQGVMLRGAGAVNEAVGGTAVAMPLDASGALLWNPASISAFKNNEMTFGLGLIQSHSRVNSSIGPVKGSTKGEAGVVPVPSMGFVWRPKNSSSLTFGIGLAGVGGAASLYSQDLTNPVLNATGRSANVIVLQMTPTVSVKLSRRLSVGAAPIIDLASLNINPMSLGRNAADPLMTYGTKYVWGAGFQAGVLYDFKNHFKAGFTLKSPIWAEKLYFSGTSSNGTASNNTFDLNLPMTISAGISYDGFKNTVVGMDVRYFDYAHTTGFDKGIVAGNVKGLDWESVFSVSFGLEHQYSERVKLRMGYCWNENPIPDRSAVLCVSAPMITQHVLSLGFGYTFANGLEVSGTWCHAFEAKSTGPMPIPNAGVGSVTNILSADSFIAGITKKW